MKKSVTRIFAVAAVLGTGLWIRGLEPVKLAPAWWPWKTTAVTLYFSDGHFFFPVSRRMPTTDDLPRLALQALLAGPSPGSGLKNLIPAGVEIRSFTLADGAAQIDLSEVIVAEQNMHDAEMAIVQTMTRLPGVTSVSLSVEGKLLVQSARRTPFLYYPSEDGLVAVSSPATNPREALAAYLSGPPSSELTHLPPDARLLAHEYDSAGGLLSLQFAYTPLVRELALEKPHQMRTLLLGLIAGLTEFSEIRAVRLDFGGQTRLGLGECSDLLGTPQPRPDLLNDERLLEW